MPRPDAHSMPGFIACNENWRECANVAHHAVQFRDLDTLRGLAARNHSLTSRDSQSKTPMSYLLPCCFGARHYSAGVFDNHFRDVFSFLIETEARHDRCGACARTVLQRYLVLKPVDEAHTRAVIRLLRASVDLLDGREHTAFDTAVSTDNLFAITELASIGALFTKHGDRTALSYALRTYVPATSLVMKCINVGIRPAPGNLQNALRTDHVLGTSRSDVLVCLYLAGCDLPSEAVLAGSRDALCQTSLALLRVLFAGDVPDDWRRMFTLTSRRIIIDDSINACVAMHGLDLPALITYDILASMFDQWPRIRMHSFWEIVTYVKHWRDRGDK